jgi:trimeric autotransporter adhesin
LAIRRLTTTTGFNTAVGRKALFTNTTGGNNNAFGADSLGSNTTGNDNNAVGQNSLYSNTTGISNTAVGHYALQGNTTASNNTAVGYQAAYYQYYWHTQHSFSWLLTLFLANNSHMTTYLSGRSALISQQQVAANTAVGSRDALFLKYVLVQQILHWDITLLGRQYNW